METVLISEEHPLLAFRDFRRADGSIDYHALVSAVTREGERTESAFLTYLGAMLTACGGASKEEVLSVNELLTLLRHLHDGMADDFSTFTMYQKLCPGMTATDWQILMRTHEPPLSPMNRAHNIFLSILENVLGLPRGTLSDPSRL